MKRAASLNINALILGFNLHYAWRLSSYLPENSVCVGVWEQLPPKHTRRRNQNAGQSGDPDVSISKLKSSIKRVFVHELCLPRGLNPCFLCSATDGTPSPERVRQSMTDVAGRDSFCARAPKHSHISENVAFINRVHKELPNYCQSFSLFVKLIKTVLKARIPRSYLGTKMST
jgi:hypothetical protein